MIEEIGTIDKPAAERFFVRPDLGTYGLKEPWRDDLFWKKGVLHAATYPEINLLDIRCPQNHQHQIVRGSVRMVSVRWASRVPPTSAYPRQLGKACGVVVGSCVLAKEVDNSIRKD